MTLPPDNQNSASPYALTARILRRLWVCQFKLHQWYLQEAGKVYRFGHFRKWARGTGCVGQSRKWMGSSGRCRIWKSWIYGEGEAAKGRVTGAVGKEKGAMEGDREAHWGLWSRNGICRTGNLTRKGSVEPQLVAGLMPGLLGLALTIHAIGIAQAGMLSLQKPRTSVRAVISKGIRSAS